MTDKQIIIDNEKFEKAENEPINQEAVNKFIEETNKFYVDGVDVSGCCHQGKNETCTCPHYKNECTRNPNCHYKIMERQVKKLDKLHKKNLELEQQLKRKEQECDNLQGEISHYEHDLGWCSSLIDLYEEKLMKTFYALHQIQLHNLKIKDKDIHLILKEVKEDLKEYNKIKNEELDKKVKDE